MVELCAKNLQIMRNDFTDYALTFGQLCANYAHFLPIMRRLCATILKIMRALCQLCAPTGAVPANQPLSGGEATDRCKSFRRKMADCPS